MSERARIFGILFLASLPLVLLATINLWQSVSEAQERVSTERVALARAAALTAGQSVDADKRSLRAAGRALGAQWTSLSDVRDEDLWDFVDRESNLGTLVLFDRDGWNVAVSDRSLPPRSLNMADRTYFRDALRDGSGLSASALRGRITGQPALILAHRVDLASGETAVLAASVSIQRLGEDLRAYLAERGVDIIIVDADGQVVLHPEPELIPSLPSLRGRGYADAALSGTAGSTVDIGFDGQELLIAYAPVPMTPWAILVQQPTALAFEAARRDMASGFGLFAVAALLASALGLNLASRLTSAYSLEREARTAAEAAAEELRLVTAENEQRRRFLERLIVSAPIPIAITRGPEHRFLTANPRYQLLKPGTPMVGRTFDVVFPEVVPLGVLDCLDQVYQSGRELTLVDQSRTFVDSTGEAEERYFTIVYAPYDDAEGRTEGVLIIALETSDAVRARMKSEREKDEFLSTASHELKSPLTALALAAQMIDRVVSRDPDSYDERLQRSVRGIIRQVDRAGELINDLLEVSRLRRAGPSLRRDPVNLTELVTAAVERTVDALPEDARHQVKVTLGDEITTVEGDETRLDQVLTNLLSNAVKYSSEGGIIEISLTQRLHTVELRIADRGMGVPEDEQSLLFLPFSRTTTARDSSIEGTGLGLYITRQIVEAHGGSIQFEPTPGGGATFIVRLPLHAVDSPNSGPPMGSFSVSRLGTPRLASGQ